MILEILFSDTFGVLTPLSSCEHVQLDLSWSRDNMNGVTVFSGEDTDLTTEIKKSMKKSKRRSVEGRASIVGAFVTLKVLQLTSKLFHRRFVPRSLPPRPL